MNKANDFLNGIKSIGKYISDRFYLTSLNDTPTGYLGHGGDYLVVNENENGISFTGIEKVAEDLDLIGYNTIPQYGSEDLPAASTQVGKIVASGCNLLYSCNGKWTSLSSTSTTTSAPKDAPSCVSNLDEYVEYNEYRQNFLSENLLDSLKNALEFDIDPLIIDVCVHPESNLTEENNIVKIEESTYKWGIFSSAQTLNITATPFSDELGNNCVFQNWDSAQANLADEFSSSTSFFADRDMSITGYFTCTLAPNILPSQQLSLHVQSSNTQILEKSNNNHTLNNVNEVVLDNQNQLFNTNTLNFTGASYIEVGNSNDFQFLHDGSSNYTVEFWTKPKNITTEIDPDAISGGSVGTWQYQYIEGTPLNLFDSDDSTHYSVRNIESTLFHPDFSIQLQVNFPSPIGNIDQIKWTFRVTECCGGRALYIKRASDGQWMTAVLGGSGGDARTDTGDGPFPAFDAIKMAYNGRSTSPQQFYNFGVDFLVNALNPDLPTQAFNPVSAPQPILSTANASNMHGIDIAIRGSSLQSTIYNGTNSPYAARLSSSTGIQANEWQHVALTFDKNLNKIYMHLNGVYQGEYATITNLSQEPQSQILKIGSSNNGSAFQFLNGNIQDLRISKGIIYSDRGPFSTPNQLF